jgi:hypothetical protein
MRTMKLARTLMAVALGVCSGMPLLAQEKSHYQDNQDKSEENALLNACKQNRSFADSHADLCKAAKMTSSKDEMPPQSLLDYIRKSVEGACAANKDKEPDQAGCVARFKMFEKFRQFQFLVGASMPDAADYGWLAEFDRNDCEAKSECAVFFFVPLVQGTISSKPDPANYDGNNLAYLEATATVEKARQLKNGWCVALQYKGNLQSVNSSAENGTSLSPNYSAIALALNGHTWQYNPQKFSYFDDDEYREKLAKEEKKQDQEEQARARRNSEWLRRVVLALPLHFGQSQAETKEVLQRNNYNLSVTGTLWSCQSNWQLNTSDILARQGVVQELLTSCLTEYKQSGKEVELALEFELAQRKRNPDRGTLYEVPTDRLTMAIFKYEGKEVADSLVESFKRMSPHDCKIVNAENKEYGNSEECVPF